jgi:hypothetical protein
VNLKTMIQHQEHRIDPKDGTPFPMNRQASSVNIFVSLPHLSLLIITSPS